MPNPGTAIFSVIRALSAGAFGMQGTDFCDLPVANTILKNFMSTYQINPFEASRFLLRLAIIIGRLVQLSLRRVSFYQREFSDQKKKSRNSWRTRVVASRNVIPQQLC